MYNSHQKLNCVKHEMRKRQDSLVSKVNNLS